MNDLLIINPRSNHGRALENFKGCVASAPKALRTRIEKVKSITLQPGTSIASLAEIKTAKRIFVVGGDGSLNSLVNALFILKRLDQTAIAHLPAGFGNGVSAMLGIEDLKSSLNLFHPKTHTISSDLLHTNLKTSPIGLFCAGIGYDASLMKYRQNFTFMRGAAGYLFCGCLSLFKKRNLIYRISLDGGAPFQVRSPQLIVANGPYYGPLKAVPKAKFNDGVLDLRVFPHLLHFFLNSQPRKLAGYPVDGLSCLDARFSQITIETPAKEKWPVQIDGDPHEHRGRLEIKVLKKALRYLTLRKETVEKPTPKPTRKRRTLKKN